jgi:S-adenosylmethionine:diacylglycerol 3-amino-3-carboxypropyl transferase
MKEPIMSDDGHRLLERVEWVRDVTVDQLVSWCIQRDLDPSVVSITSSHLKFVTPETADEKKRREEWEYQTGQRTEKWERETLARLTAKYAGTW